jgi:carbamoyl-phosphate synthase large subunit
MINILLTSVGRRSYLVEYFKKAIGDNGQVHVMNSTRQTPAFAVADRAVESPLIYDDDYIPYLLDYCKRNNIKAVISCFDVDLSILAANKHLFSEIGTTVVVADSGTISVCEDKWEMYNYLYNKSVDTPKTYLNINAVKAELLRGQFSYPLIIKPRWGMGSKFIYEADDDTELEVLYKKTQKDIKKSYLRYESALNFDKAVIIQEKVTGQEYGLDIINDLNGNYINTCIKLKKAMRAGETDCAITVDNKSLSELGRLIGETVKHPAILDVDVIKSNNSGKYYVLDMNPRFGGGYPFSHLAGVDLPKAIISWLQGMEVDTHTLSPRLGVLGHKDIRMTELLF